MFGDFFRLTRNGSWAAAFFENREPYLLSCYLGVFSLLLALFGLLLSERRWMSRTLALVALLALLLASGKYGPVYEQLFKVLSAVSLWTVSSKVSAYLQLLPRAAGWIWDAPDSCTTRSRAMEAIT